MGTKECTQIKQIKTKKKFKNNHTIRNKNIIKEGREQHICATIDTTFQIAVV